MMCTWTRRTRSHVLLATDRRWCAGERRWGRRAFCRRTAASRRGRSAAFSGDAQHAATVYVGVVNDKDAGGVFVSHTGGLSWSHLSDGLDGHDVFSAWAGAGRHDSGGNRAWDLSAEGLGLATRWRRWRRARRRWRRGCTRGRQDQGGAEMAGHGSARRGPAAKPRAADAAAR